MRDTLAHRMAKEKVSYHSLFGSYGRNNDFLGLCSTFLKYWSRKLFQIESEKAETMHFDRSRREESNGDVKTRLGFSEVLQKPLGFQKPPPNSSKNPTRWVLIFARVSSRLNKWSWRKRQKTSKSNVKGDYALFDSKIDITLERKLQT